MLFSLATCLALHTASPPWFSQPCFPRIFESISRLETFHGLLILPPKRRMSGSRDEEVRWSAYYYSIPFTFNVTFDALITYRPRTIAELEYPTCMCRKNHLLQRHGVSDPDFNHMNGDHVSLWPPKRGNEPPLRAKIRGAGFSNMEHE